ncbi:hypothetical protein LWE61_01460 [Sphingobium sufflavum]|uniref:hypothetical protein n=1 Tax=Sphingobium sufflavum TaxID=1129547 RepID=UPI001F356DA4|nr:hypothetical protein [Sphingobium sufflavum]MCE7795217.1 hypothetical protein [Sphingobium sufflavum]
MLTIATPDLSPQEWTHVRRALDTVADCGCGDPPAPGSLRDRIGRAVDAVAGRDHRQPDLSPYQRAIRDFLCDSARVRGVAEAHVPTLHTHGFNRAQIEALALVGA